MEKFDINNPREIWDTMKNMAGKPNKRHKLTIKTDKLTSSVEQNTFFAFETPGV